MYSINIIRSSMNKKNASQITFVFSLGRMEKLGNKDYAEEFFYSYHLFKKNFENVKIFEFQNNNRKLLVLLDKVLRKITNLPIYLDVAQNKHNFNSLKDNDYIIFGNDRLAISSLFMIRKINKSKNLNSSFFVMGLFAKKKGNLFTNKLQKVIMLALFKHFTNLLFLSKGELEAAVELFPEFKNKFTFIPFSIDTKFWNVDYSESNQKKEKILFIGNDGRRDYKKVIQIAKNLPNYQFTFITSQIDPSDLISSNVELINGNWNLSLLNDTQIKKHYSEAKFTIIPLIDSFQPSGQSVALQSMATGTPVIISKTRGFWSPADFNHNDEIFFVDDNSLENWTSFIEEIYDNESLLKNVSLNGKSLVQKKYNLEVFYKLVVEQLKLN